MPMECNTVSKNIKMKLDCNEKNVVEYDRVENKCVGLLFSSPF